MTLCMQTSPGRQKYPTHRKKKQRLCVYYTNIQGALSFFLFRASIDQMFLGKGLAKYQTQENQGLWLFETSLVGGTFNPSEKYARQIGSFHQGSG